MDCLVDGRRNEALGFSIRLLNLTSFFEFNASSFLGFEIGLLSFLVGHLAFTFVTLL